jgi:hypothetical protein
MNTLELTAFYRGRDYCITVETCRDLDSVPARVVRSQAIDQIEDEIGENVSAADLSIVGLGDGGTDGYVAADHGSEKTTQEARDHRAAHNRSRILRNDRGGGL